MEQEQRETPRIETETDPIVHPNREQRLRSLVTQAGHSQLSSTPPSNASALSEFHALVDAQTKRVDQIAQGMQEMWDRVGNVLGQMLNFMKIQEVVIGHSDDLNQQVEIHMDQLGTVTQALAKVTQEVAMLRDYLLNESGLDDQQPKG